MLFNICVVLTYGLHRISLGAHSSCVVVDCRVYLSLYFCLRKLSLDVRQPSY